MEICGFEIAKKLKEKGFRERTFGFYLLPIKLPQYPLTYITGNHNKEDDFYSAPTISQVLKWLREEKKIHVEPCILADADIDADGKVINEYTYWSFSVTHIETGDMIYFEYERIDDKRFDSYELAALAGIEYCLDNLIYV